MDERVVWDRQEGESSLWYGRFDEYRLMGPERSVLSVVNRRRRDQSKKQAKYSPGAWLEKANTFKWRERAEAWDESERQRQAALREIEADKLFENIEQALKALYAKYSQRLQELDPDDIPAAVLAPHFLSTIKKLEEHYGRQAVKKVELSGPEGKPIAIDLELRRIISQRAEEFQEGKDKNDP